MARSPWDQLIVAESGKTYIYNPQRGDYEFRAMADHAAGMTYEEHLEKEIVLFGKVGELERQPITNPGALWLCMDRVIAAHEDANAKDDPLAPPMIRRSLSDFTWPRNGGSGQVLKDGLSKQRQGGNGMASARTLWDQLIAGAGDAVTDIREKLVEAPWYGKPLDVPLSDLGELSPGLTPKGLGDNRSLGDRDVGTPSIGLEQEPSLDR